MRAVGLRLLGLALMGMFAIFCWSLFDAFCLL